MYLIWSCILIVCLHVNSNQSCLLQRTRMPENHEGCRTQSNGTKLLCNKYLNVPNGSEEIRFIELCYLNETVIYLNRFLNEFPNLENFILAYSNISKIDSKHIKENYNTKTLRINNNTKITEIDGDIFGKLKNLKLLDLRNNSIETLDYKNIDFFKNISEIYLAGNKWNCSKNVNWAYELTTSHVKDIKNLTCSDEHLDGKPLYFVAQVTKQSKEECPPSCECSLSNVFRDAEIDKLQPIVEVECSKRNFTELPRFLPKYTKILRLEKNQIVDISPLVKDPIYRDVSDLYIDHNLINSIDMLEGSHWLANFRVLSLRGNKLSELPTYAMDNALQQNPNMPNAILLYLGSNPWRCDCIFTPGFQEDILVKYESQIQDMRDVKCAFIEGDENSMNTIVQLSRSSICQLPSEYSIKALDLLNGILASLIVLVLGKLAYDYYYFKKTGKLPWIVMKIP